MNLFNIEFNNLNKQQILQTVGEYLDENKYHQIATINPEFLVEANRNSKFKQVLQKCDLNIADGFGITLAAILINQKPPTRIPGADLMMDIIQICANKNYKVLLFGGLPGVGEKAKYEILKKNPNLKIKSIAGGAIKYNKKNNTFSQDENIFRQINQFMPDIIFVALGSPKQELWLAQNYGKINSVKIGMGVGGSLDFIAKLVPRAPILAQKMGLEWIFRLLKQPYRLKRIFEATIVYLWLVFKYHIINKNEQ